MNKLKYVIRYFVEHYPYGNELSKTRITKMVYLADWYSAIEREKQITNIKWFFNHYGPYVEDVYEAAKKDNYLIIEGTYNQYGSPKEIIAINEKRNISFFEKLGGGERLDIEEEGILKKVILQTESLTWNSFIDLVYETYPIRSQERFSELDLVALAKEENEYSKL